MDETMTCPVRGESAKWTDRGCSACGSMAPEEFLELARAGAKVVISERINRVCLSYFGGRRLQREHLDPVQDKEIEKLIGAKQLAVLARLRKAQGA